MKNIVLTRVDDRLLHGQVVISWVPYLHADEIVVVDNDYAEDEFLTDILKEAAPENVVLKVMTLSDAASYLKSEDDGQRTLVLSRCVPFVYNLFRLGVDVGVLNIGSLGLKAKGNRRLSYVNLSENDFEMLSEMEVKGVNVELRLLPTNEPAMLDSVKPDYAGELCE